MSDVFSKLVVGGSGVSLNWRACVHADGLPHATKSTSPASAAQWHVGQTHLRVVLSVLSIFWRSLTCSSTCLCVAANVPGLLCVKNAEVMLSLTMDFWSSGGPEFLVACGRKQLIRKKCCCFELAFIQQPDATSPHALLCQLLLCLRSTAAKARLLLGRGHSFIFP